MFNRIEGVRLRTNYADAPLVSLRGSEGSTDCEMSFDSSAIDDEGRNWMTKIRFVRVLDLRFSDFDLGLDLPDSEAFEYGLIELTSSETLRSFRSSGVLERPASPVTREPELRHFRIAFDDHGTYDIICLGIELAYEFVANDDTI
jgi:hypothetical protein